MFGLAHDDWVPACLAPAVRSGIYTYHGRTGLAVNGVPRCPKTQLLEHLAFVDPGPALTKKGKPRVRQPPRPQDQSVEFYRAQMVHYGLASQNATREAAKVALGATKLAVPNALLEIEAKLKKLYDAENDKMRRAAIDKQRAEEAAEDARRKKRDRDEEDLIKNVLGDQPPGKRAKAGKPKASNRPINLDTVSGVYTLVAPKVASNWETPYDGIIFKLALSPKRSHIWGSFDFGPFEGTLRSTSSLTAPDGTIRFHWRGRDTGSGESTYGPDNVGSIQFLPGGKIKGELVWDCCSGAIAFAGVRNSEKTLNTEDEDDVRGWKDEYWRLNEENYEHESRARWPGGRSYSPSGSREPNSDTEEENSDNQSADGYEDCGF
ncbi:hypothetical protein AURDEDRAFT_173294 [Auricularia subglabra TFB-10046 SS5]|uniref:Uncharacterized protein n=1 Tax=Auricularia subglabra (strain TFB-10046 / SS5) TaxID=717982 RepID=J0WUL0_AURST|nr:hypothetical protein AURDEDRAFT_173294 [Auricularia subglabra TFB-10046 SS5]